MAKASHSDAWFVLPFKFWLLAVLLFTALAATLNLVRLPLFFGIEFIFGSVVAVLAIVLLGVKAAVIVGCLGAAVTFVIWGHPYAWLIFSLEILWLCWQRQSRQGMHLVLQDLVFWVLFGLPLIIVCYVFALDASWQTAALVGLKQMTNGVFNTLLASTLLLLMQLQPVLSKRFKLPLVSLRQLLFHTLMGLTLFSGSVPLLLDARKLNAEYESSVAQRLKLLTTILQQQLQTLGTEQRNDPRAVAALMRDLLPYNDVGLALLDSKAQRRYEVGLLQSLNTEAGTIPVVGFSKWLPTDVNLRLQRWRKSRYRYILHTETLGEVNYIVAEQGATTVVMQLEQASARQLVLMVSFMLLTVLVSSLLSKAISAPVKRLVLVSSRLTGDIARGNLSEIPPSHVAEYHKLSQTLQVMSTELARTFTVNHATQLTLTQQVAEQTKQLQQSNSQLEAILAAAADFSIIATDLDGVITYFSRGAERLLGYRAEELVNSQTPAVFHLESEVQQRAAALSAELNQQVTPFQAFVIIAEQTGSESREWQYVRKDGQTIPVLLTVTPIIDATGVTRGYLGIAKDISERHRNEKLKNEFISTVSHELRTPLTSIYGALRVVNSGTLAELPPKVASLLRVAEVNSKRLTNLINDLLDIEKLLAGKMQLDLKIQPLLELVEEAVVAVTSYAEQYQVKLHTLLPSENCYAKVDATKLVQVLINLLSNAIKFSAAEATVQVRLLTMPSEVKIVVVDQGAGITDVFKAHIFERFSQGDAASTRKYGGTGLGLAISKELTEQMGGVIGFSSEVAKGSSFWITFPRVLPKEDI
ncbi:hypothetical protein GCM10010919_26880 [Alishewanella longhuensis]|uniref:histidine kinase n=1 Tax=Alishewanella longhuensis TaxID=1091037 RepID=A0ABQ3L041_9ALTE|nr:ATP-binding protein [Alishewanella longhuensis]GHG73764.1 hypothetical protein GCM10010919_26880 [Alishewanella longhuensis]